jgi:predicted amidophosphoribosyltransferase
MENAPMTHCADCGTEVPLCDALVNNCPECGAPHSSTGQRLKDDHNTASTLARERGRDPGVGDPGVGEPPV